MTTCRDVLDLLLEHCAGETSPREDEIVRKHLESCEACRRHAADLRAEDFMLRFALDDRPAPDAMVRRVVRRLKDGTKPDGMPPRCPED